MARFSLSCFFARSYQQERIIRIFRSENASPEWPEPPSPWLMTPWEAIIIPPTCSSPVSIRFPLRPAITGSHGISGPTRSKRTGSPKTPHLRKSGLFPQQQADCTAWASIKITLSALRSPRRIKHISEPCCLPIPNNRNI